VSVIKETKRLILRRWQEDDRAVFRAMNADAQVMAHFPGTLTKRQSDALLDSIMSAPPNQGLCAVEVKTTGEIAGACGLYTADIGEPELDGNTEIAWRFIPSQWGQGYAREAGLGWLEIGFETLGLNEIYAWTAQTNKRSLAVMRAVGMERLPERDFIHPGIPDSHPQLKAHLVTRMTAREWRSKQK